MCKYKVQYNELYYSNVQSLLINLKVGEMCTEHM